MSVNIFIISISVIYVFNVFLVTWLSGRFAGIRPFSLSKIGALGLALILFSWLSLTAFIHVTLILKPLILLLYGIVSVYIFIAILDTHLLRALVAGSFFILCQFVIFIFVIQKLWHEDFFQIVKLMLFQYY